MQGSYSSIYLRHKFTVDEIPATLALKHFIEDGAVVWINGTEVFRNNVTPIDPVASDTADGSLATEPESLTEVPLPDPATYLVIGENTLAVQAFNSTRNNADFAFDCALVRPATADGAPPMPTPGQRNSTFTETSPPALRQVAHLPEAPASGEAVVVSVKASDPDGVASVSLEYLVVAPGSYIRKSDPGFDSGWITLAMADPDGDEVYTAEIPAQPHRSLVRYRITAADTGGASVSVPYEDDDSPNFAYFVYDGVPEWVASEDGTTKTFGTDLMNALPVFHLLADATDVERSQYEPAFDGQQFSGTFVAGNKVYDHIRFRNRGETTTYLTGKNKWRINFNRARDFAARDRHGDRFSKSWSELDLNTGTLAYARNFRGNGILDEALTFRLFELAGVPAPSTRHVHFRVIDDASENGDDQWSGDNWGLYLQLETVDGDFIDNRDLAEGNIYKVKPDGAGGPEKDFQAVDGVTNDSDVTSFRNAIRRTQNLDWWRENLDVDTYYSFHAMNLATNNEDLQPNRNHILLNSPEGRWTPIPWDVDHILFPTQPAAPRLTTDLVNSIGQHAELTTEYKNRAREILDLLAQDDQIEALVDEISQPLVTDIDTRGSFAEVDYFLWDNHPNVPSGYRDVFYQDPATRNALRIEFEPPGGRDITGRVAYYKALFARDDTTYSNSSGIANLGFSYRRLRDESADENIPSTPSITYTGEAGFPTTGLQFATTAAGAETQWRIGEIFYPGISGYLPDEANRYEIESIWETASADTAAVPAAVTRPGRTYRARVRVLDTEGRASHWSSPIEFTAGAPDPTPYQSALVVSELMYNPPTPSGAELEVSAENGDYEYIELSNMSLTQTLDLGITRFTRGIDFDFAPGTLLPPGASILVVKDIEAFTARYGSGLPVAGSYGGDNLSNSGEMVRLSLGAGTVIREFEYDDMAPWPLLSDGQGASLTLRHPSTLPDHALASSWRAGAPSPGTFGGTFFSGDPTGDVNGNTIPNLVEYAAGTDFGFTGTTFSHQKILAADDVQLTVEVSSDLKEWTQADSIVDESYSDGRVTYSMTFDDSIRFARIVATAIE